MVFTGSSPSATSSQTCARAIGATMNPSRMPVSEAAYASVPTGGGVPFARFPRFLSEALMCIAPFRLT